MTCRDIVPDSRASLAARTIAMAALIVFLVLSITNVALVRWLDNTNLETSNGLWKMPDIRAWEKTGHGSLDSGGFLYFPTYGMAARLLPHSWFTYGTPPAWITHRKMAALNALFGALASSVLFLIACRLTNRLLLSTAVAGLHATAGFVLLNSLNSEDVIPAYALFICMTACIWLFLETEMVAWLAAATLFLSLVAFFHWTLFPPAAAGLAIALFLGPSTRRASLWLPVLALAAAAAWTVAASTSTLSTPTPARPTTLSSGAASITLRLTLVSERTASAAASLTKESSSSSFGGLGNTTTSNAGQALSTSMPLGEMGSQTMTFIRFKRAATVGEGGGQVKPSKDGQDVRTAHSGVIVSTTRR